MRPAARGPGGRKLVSTKRIRGTVLDWFDKFGWIQATQEIDHPEAHRNNGKIYLLAEDVQEDLPGVGCAVTFFLYQDANGLGAMNVRPDQHGQGQKGGKGFGGKAAPGGKAPGGKAAHGGKAHGGKAPPTQGYAPPQYAASKAQGMGYRGGYAPVQKGPVMPHEEVMQKVHACLNKQVWKATKKIAEKEKDWDQTELSKRITKYLYKGAQAPELLTLPWHQAGPQFIETAMRGYSNACADKPWFFDLDLTVAFHMAFWEILNGSGQNAQWSEVERVLNAKYEELMDGCLLEKAIWDSACLLLPDQESLSNKLYKGLKTAHEKAFEEAMATPVADDLQRVEFFTRSWILHSMGKVWQAAEQGGLMNQESMAMLFQELLAPFGEEHPFSCVPGVLTQSIGRPPRDWEFLQEAVREFFLNWNSSGETQPGPNTYGSRRGVKRPAPAQGGPVSIMPAKGGGGQKRQWSGRAAFGDAQAAPETAETIEIVETGETGETGEPIMEDVAAPGLEAEEEDAVSKALMEQVAAAEMAAGEA